MSYKQFLELHQLNSDRLWQSFYEFNENRIEIKKAKVAKANLAKIINATFKLSGEQGFALMSLRDLSRETGMSLGSIYSYINSKEHLSLMVHEFLPHIFRQIINTEDLIGDIDFSSEEKLRYILRDHLYLTEFMHEWFLFAYMEAKYTSNAIKKIARANESMSEQILFSILGKSYELVEEDAKKKIWMKVMFLKAQLQAWYLKRKFFRQKNITVDDYLDTLNSMLKNF